MRYEAEAIRPGRYVVRPAGQLGACGWHPKPWTAVFINARSPAHALLKFHTSHKPDRGEPIVEQ